MSLFSHLSKTQQPKNLLSLPSTWNTSDIIMTDNASQDTKIRCSQLPVRTTFSPPYAPDPEGIQKPKTAITVLSEKVTALGNKLTDIEEGSLNHLNTSISDLSSRVQSLEVSLNLPLIQPQITQEVITILETHLTPKVLVTINDCEKEAERRVVNKVSQVIQEVEEKYMKEVKSCRDEVESLLLSFRNFEHVINCSLQKVTNEIATLKQANQELTSRVDELECNHIVTGSWEDEFKEFKEKILQEINNIHSHDVMSNIASLRADLTLLQGKSNTIQQQQQVGMSMDMKRQVVKASAPIQSTTTKHPPSAVCNKMEVQDGF